MGRIFMSGIIPTFSYTPVDNTILASSLEIGSSIFIREGNSLAEYLVVNQGIPGNFSLYHENCDGTWIMRKNLHSSRIWSSTNNDLAYAEIGKWLDGDYFNSLGSIEQEVIKQVQITWCNGTGQNGGMNTSPELGYYAKVFLPSCYELGFTTATHAGIFEDGAVLKYFEGVSITHDERRIAYLDGVVTQWWTRMAEKYSTTAVAAVDITTENYGGVTLGKQCTETAGVRPMMILPKNTLIYAGSRMIKGVLNISLSDTFADNSWADIITACQNNIVPDTWVVGNQKTMTINGTDYLIDIIGKNHDTYADGGGTAPLTFQLHDCYGTLYQMNSSKTNVNGWSASVMRSTHLPAILALMPSEVQAGIKEVNKLTTTGHQVDTIVTTVDKLFLLSVIEVMSEDKFTGDGYAYLHGEGSRYDYYKDGNSILKKVNNEAKNWWLRSPSMSNTTNFYCIDYLGSNFGTVSANSTNGISFAFCF